MKFFDRTAPVQDSMTPQFAPPPTANHNKKKRSCKPRWGIRYWNWPRLMLALVILEYPLTVAALAFTGIADPDTWRTALWQDGYDNGFNSNPLDPLYAAANYEPVSTPLVWSAL